MTKLTVQGGKLLVRSGKLGVEQECCCTGGGTGACCTCLDTGNAIIGNGSTFDNENDAAQLASENNDLLQTILLFMQNNGHTCITSESSSYFQNDEGNWQVNVAQAAGKCCGAIDETIEVYPFVYACIPDETSNRTCLGGFTSQQCADACGEFFLGQACPGPSECPNPLP